jgi:hypothetical protein
MNICKSDTGWGMLYSVMEYSTVGIILILYTRSAIRIVKSENSAEYLDKLIILLSTIQIYLLLISQLVLEVNYFFRLMVELIKFNQNSIVCGYLIMQLLVYKLDITLLFHKIYIGVIIALNAIFILFTIIGESNIFFEKADSCGSFILLVIPITGLIEDLGILSYAIYWGYDENTEKSLQMLVEEESFINDRLKSFNSSMKRNKVLNLIILITFLFSYVFDVYLKSMVMNSKLNSCLLFEGNFFIKQFSICYISLWIKDLLFHACIYIAFIWYKPKTKSRSPSLIELI